MAFKIKEGLTINTTAVFNDSATLLVNAPTATKWETARTLSLAGDASGSVSIDGSSDVTLTVTVNGVGESGGTPVFTGDITGDLTGDVYAENGTTKVLENSAAGTGAWFMGDLRATNGTTTVLTVGNGTTTPQFEGNANTADAWSTARDFTVTLTGDVTGTVTQSVDGSGNETFSIAATIAADSVALGTDTTGNYVASVGVTAGTGLSVTGTGEGAAVVLAGVDATTTTKGVASFNADDFDVASGAVSLEDTVVKGLTVDAGATVTPSGHSVQITGGEGIDVTASGAVITVAGEDATTTNKGIASFNTDHFTVTSGAVSAKSATLGSSTITLGSTTTALAGLTQLNVDNIQIDANTISSTNTDGNIVLDPNGNGVVNVSSTRITNLATPTTNTDAATKEYVDTIASASIHYHAPVRVETPTELTATYANGTAGVGATLTGAQEVLVIDGITLALNDRVLVYQQTNAAHNGVYYVSTLGVAGTTAWVLTRATDADGYAPSDPDNLGTGDAFYVKEGNTGAGELYVMNTEGTITFGTTAINFVQISSAQIYQAGAALSLDGVTFNVNVDNSSIEVSGDALRVKALGITNAMLAGSIANNKLLNSTITIAGDTGTADPVSLGETLTISGGVGLSSVVSNNNLTVNLDNTTVTAGSYGSASAVATFTVDAQGRLTAAASTNIAIASTAITDFTEAVQDVVGGMVSTNTESGIAVTYDDTNGKLDFDVADFTITLTGDVTGTGTVTNLGNVSFATTIAANSVALGTDTTGDYVATIAAGTGIAVTGAGTEGRAATVALSHLGIQDLVDPNADRILFWDDSATKAEWLTVGTGLSLSGTSLTSNTTISVTDTPGAGTFSETGSISTSSFGTVTLASGSGIDIDVDTTNGIVRIASTAGSTFDQSQAQVSASSTAVINSFATTAFRSAKYYIQAVSGSSYQSSEVMVVHNGSTVDIIEYGVVELGTPVGNITAAVSGGNVNISFVNNLAATANIVIRRLGIPDYA